MNLPLFVENCIDVPSMDGMYTALRRSRRKAQQMTNSHHFQVELFYAIIDMQLQELNSRFNEVNTELLLCVSCLNPSSSFVAFNRLKLINLAQLYPKDFLDVELLSLSDRSTRKFYH